MRLIFIILFIVLPQIQVKAKDGRRPTASCPEFQQWGGSYFKEFDDEYLEHQRNGSQNFHHIRNNLFSDKFSKPIFGKAFDELPTSKRYVIEVKLRKCIGKKSYQSSLRGLNFFTSNAFSQQRQFEAIYAGVREIRDERKKYNEVIARLNDNNKLLNPDEVSRMRTAINSDFWHLLDSEKEYLRKKVDDYQLNLDRDLFITEAERLSNTTATTHNLYEIVKLENKNFSYILVDEMPFAVRQANQKLVKHKVSIIKTLMANVSNQLSLEMYRFKFQSAAKEFKHEFGKFMLELLIVETYEELLDRGLQIMKKNESDFFSRVNNAQTPGELKLKSEA